MVDLSETRVKIDEIDRKIISLFNERMKLADDVANYKIATGKPVYDAVREKEKLLVIGALERMILAKRPSGSYLRRLCQ